MRAKDIRVGQVFKWVHPTYNDFLGVFVLTTVDHDESNCYVTFKKLWLWHVDQFVNGCQTSGGCPWEGSWPHELVA